MNVPFRDLRIARNSRKRRLHRPFEYPVILQAPGRGRIGINAAKLAAREESRTGDVVITRDPEELGIWDHGGVLKKTVRQSRYHPLIIIIFQWIGQESSLIYPILS
jgi:hypothetical protein